MYRSLVSSFAALSLFVSSMLFVPPARAQTAEVAAAATPSVAAILATRPDGTFSGTGFMAADHLVLTTYHSVRGATRITLKFPDYPEVGARLVQGDRDSDVAVLSIPALPVRPLPLGDIGQVREGQTVVVIGFPLTQGLGTTTATVTEETVSAVHPPIIQMRASLSPSNSGGPVLNVQGEVVGIAEAMPQGDFATATAINPAKPLLGAAASAPPLPFPSVSAEPSRPAASSVARTATLEIKGWSFIGNLTYQTNAVDPTLGPVQSVLVFPAMGTMPILRLDSYPVILRFGSSSINQATSTDSDWIFNTNPTNPVSVTQQSSSGNTTLFTGDILLGRKGSDAQFYIGYESHAYNFTWTGPVVLTSCIPSPLIPTCPPLPSTQVPGTGTVLTYNATYAGPRVGLVGDWRLSNRVRFSADVGYGFINFNGLDYHVLRGVTFPQSGSGSALLGEVAIGYIFTNDLSVRLGYQYASLHASGQTMVCFPAFSSACSPPYNLTTVDTTSKGVTAGLLWKF